MKVKSDVKGPNSGLTLEEFVKENSDVEFTVSAEELFEQCIKPQLDEYFKKREGRKKWI